MKSINRFFPFIIAVTDPNKLVSVVFRCSMLYIDFEGRSDGESIKRILSLVNPRNLVSLCFISILVHVSQSSLHNYRVSKT